MPCVKNSSDPAKDWDVFYAANHVAVKIADLSERPDLTDVERALIRAAYIIVSDVSVDINRRTMPRLPGTEVPT